MTTVSEVAVGLGEKVASHVLLSVSALVLGIAIALPLAFWSSRSPRVAFISLGLTSLVQTVPALALLALFFPLLVSLRTLTGFPIPALGFLPALMALTLYALLPILRNAVTARKRMDPEVLEAADAVGMTPWQKLRFVEAPLALPFVVAGIRTAAVWTIGAATLATMVGQQSLGDPIFAGLQIQNWSLVLAGCTAAAGLAIMVDALIGQIEIGLARRSAWRIRLALGAIVLGVLASLAIVRGGTEPAARNPLVVIGAKNFSEQFILARLIGGRLIAEGYRVSYREGLGSSIAYKALASGEIDAYVDYSGTLWANEMHRSDHLPRGATQSAIADWAKSTDGVEVLGALGFENAYAFAMRADRARDLGIESLEDLSSRASSLTLGADLEFLERPEWKAVRDAYRLRFAKSRRFAPSLMYDALKSHDVDVISAFSSDGRIAVDRLVVLTDPRQALPGYDALLLISRRAASDPGIIAALRPLVGAFPVEEMRRANYSVDRDRYKLTPENAAEDLACKLRLRPCL